MGSTYQKPSFDGFADMLIVQQSHLVDFGLLKLSKTKALVATDDHKSSQGEKSNNNKKQWKQKTQSETQ